jgi:replicative DNA helicase
LLTTALDKRVAASIILGAQVNREVISFDTLNLDNMREGGDIEQDANLVLGMWNDQAGKMDNLLKRLGEIERDLQEAVDQTKQISDKKSYDINKLNLWKTNVKNMIETLQNPPPNTPNTLKIKVLKNRNGQNNGVFELDGYLDRYSIEDILETKKNAIEASKNNN